MYESLQIPEIFRLSESIILSIYDLENCPVRILHTLQIVLVDLGCTSGLWQLVQAHFADGLQQSLCLSRLVWHPTGSEQLPLLAWSHQTFPDLWKFSQCRFMERMLRQDSTSLQMMNPHYHQHCSKRTLQSKWPGSSSHKEGRGWDLWGGAQHVV